MVKRKKSAKPSLPKRNNIPQGSNPTNLAEQNRQIVQVDYRGPLPPPKYLEGYEKVLPGCANRLVVMAEGFAKHQQTQEKRYIDIYENEIKRGQWILLGVSILCILIAAGLYLYKDNIYITGSFLLTSVLFLLGRGLGKGIQYLLSIIMHRRFDEEKIQEIKD